MSESEKWISDYRISTVIGRTDHVVGYVRILLDECLAAAKKDYGMSGKRMNGFCDELGARRGLTGSTLIVQPFKNENWRYPVVVYVHDPEPKVLTAQERIDKAVAIAESRCQEGERDFVTIARILRGETR